MQKVPSLVQTPRMELGGSSSDAAASSAVGSDASLVAAAQDPSHPLSEEQWPPRDIEGMRQLLRTLWPSMRPSESTLQRAVEGLAREQAVKPIEDLDLFGNHLEEHEASALRILKTLN